MAKIGLNVFVEGFTGKLLIRWLEASAPLAEVGRSAAFDFTYDDVYVIIGIQPVVHIVQLWQSTDGVALTQLIRQWEIDASIYNELTSTTYQYLVDRGFTNVTEGTGPEVWADPVNLDVNLVDERLDGATKADLLVHEAGYGNKLDADYDLLAGGGITLLNGKTFDADVAWFITYNKLTAQQIDNTPTFATGIGAVQVITVSTPLYTDADTNLYNKLVIVNSGSPICQVVFPALGSIPNGTRVIFNTHTGSQNYLCLILNGSETIALNGSARNIIYLAKGEEIELFFNAGVGYVMHYSGNDKIRGQVVGDYKVRTGSFLLANTSTGILALANYPGLEEWLNSLAGGVVLTTFAAWALEPTRWAIEGTNFRVPHLANVHRKFRTTTEAPGIFQDAAMPDHDHLIFGTGNNATISGSNYPTQSHNVGGNPSYGMYGSTTAPSLGRSSKAYINGTIQSPGLGQTQTENVVKNFKEIPLIVL